MGNFYEDSTTTSRCSSSSTVKTNKANAEPKRKTHIKGWNDVSHVEYMQSKDGQDWFRNMMNQSIKNLNSKNGTNIPYIEEPERERTETVCKNKNISPETNRCDEQRRCCRSSSKGRRQNERISKSRCSGSNKMYDWLRSEPEPEPEPTRTTVRNGNASLENRCDRPRRDDCLPTTSGTRNSQYRSNDRDRAYKSSYDPSKPYSSWTRAPKRNGNTNAARTWYDDTDSSDSFDYSASRTSSRCRNGPGEANRKSRDTNDLFRELDDVRVTSDNRGARFVGKSRNAGPTNGSSVGCRRDGTNQQVKPRVEHRHRCECHPPSDKRAVTNTKENVRERMNPETRWSDKRPSENRREERPRNGRSPCAVEEFQPVFNVHCEKADDICQWLRSQPAPAWTTALKPNRNVSPKNRCAEQRNSQNRPDDRSRQKNSCWARVPKRNEHIVMDAGHDETDRSFDWSASRTSLRRNDGPCDADRKCLEANDVFPELNDMPETRNDGPTSCSSVRCRRDEKPPQIDRRCRCACHPPAETALIELVEKIRNRTYEPPSLRRTAKFSHFF